MTVILIGMIMVAVVVVVGDDEYYNCGSNGGDISNNADHCHVILLEEITRSTE